MVVSCAHSDALAPAQMMVDEPSSVTLSVVGGVFEPLVLRAMSLTAFAPFDVTFQVANPPVAPADPASMSVELKKLDAGAAESIADRIRRYIDGIATSGTKRSWRKEHINAAARYI